VGHWLLEPSQPSEVKMYKDAGRELNQSDSLKFTDLYKDMCSCNLQVQALKGLELGAEEHTESWLMYPNQARA
jgi:hypothetical protein